MYYVLSCLWISAYEIFFPANRRKFSFYANKEGRKEIFYLMTHSTHFIYCYMASDIWLRTILIARKETPLPLHWLLFPINNKSSFYMHHPTDMIAHTTAFVTPVVEHWLEQEIAQWVHHEGSIRRPIAP